MQNINASVSVLPLMMPAAVKLAKRLETDKSNTRHITVKKMSISFDLGVHPVSPEGYLQLIVRCTQFQLSNLNKMSDTPTLKSSLSKLSILSKPKTVRIMVLGQEGVGKSALVVRFITRRFIGEYDRNLEKVYTFQTTIDNETVSFEILDSASHPQDEGYMISESNIKWSEAFILMYSVTDKCSFEDCTRLKFLINHNKKKRRLGSDSKDLGLDVPVVLVGNKADMSEDRMISREEGLGRSKDIGCVCFHEISVRESIDQVHSVFRDVFHFWKTHKKLSKMKKFGETENQKLHGDSKGPCIPCVLGINTLLSSTGSTNTLGGISSLDSDESINLFREGNAERHKKDGLLHILDLPPFRNRAQTDGNLTSRSSSTTESLLHSRFPRRRRMSISMKGKNSSC